MRKFIVFLSIVLCGSGPCFAYFCSTQYDHATQTNLNCGTIDDPHNNVASGTVAFTSFPYTNTCQRYSKTSGGWIGAVVNLCYGYTTENMNKYRARFGPVADRSQKCWRWNCSAGFYQFTGGTCMTYKEYCESNGLALNNTGTGCTTNWCTNSNGFNYSSGYNSSRHDEVKSGSCIIYRCKAGTWYNSAADRANCKACNPIQGTSGGCYANTDSSANGYVYQQCTDAQFVDFVGNQWQCTNKNSRGDDVIKKCWRCPDKAKMLACMNSNGANDCTQ